MHSPSPGSLGFCQSQPQVLQRRRRRHVDAPWRREDEMKKAHRRDYKLGRGEVEWISEAYQMNCKKKWFKFSGYGMQVK